MTVPVSVIILTYNEEANLPQALDSVCDWAHQVFVVDSFSRDGTIVVARQRGCEVLQHEFDDYASQRNFALEECDVRTPWVLFLDADEWLPEPLKEEIAAVIASNPPVDGFYLRRRLIFMGKWIRWGYYPVWLLRLARVGRVRCEERPVNEHLVVEGETARLDNDFYDENHKGLEAWVEKHLRYAELEALTLWQGLEGAEDEVGRRRWLKNKVWNRLPLLVRPWLYFGYRYFLRGGFLDGRVGFIYHFLHALWYRMLIDVEYLQLCWGRKEPSESA